MKFENYNELVVEVLERALEKAKAELVEINIDTQANRNEVVCEDCCNLFLECNEISINNMVYKTLLDAEYNCKNELKYYDNLPVLTEEEVEEKLRELEEETEEKEKKLRELAEETEEIEERLRELAGEIAEGLYELAESACKKELEEHGDCKDPMDVFEKELEDLPF